MDAIVGTQKIEQARDTSRWLDEDKLQNYLNSIDEKYHHLVHKIIKNTHYFTTEELISLVRKAMLSFIEVHPMYNILVNKYEGGKYNKIGSEHFLLLQLKDILKPQEIITFGTKPSNSYPIVIIDDAIYSGCMICGTIDYSGVDYKKNKIYAVVGVTSSLRNADLMENFGVEIVAGLDMEAYRLRNLFSAVEIEDIEGSKIHPSIESESMIPLFFEHKISNDFGTFNKVYNSIISKPISRNCIDIITPNDLADLFSFLKESK